LAANEELDLVVQVNGRVRATVRVARGLTEDQAVALALKLDAVRKFVNGKPIKKVIYVPDRLVNLVV
jgi:leucyl-tRNA synthetase